MAYVYRHIRLDKNIPFYIGIGTDKYYKRSRNKRMRNPLWKRIASKTEYEVEIILDDLTLSEAKAKEVEFIALYGRLNIGTGPLANITGGGDGMFDPPPALREAYSKKYSGEGNPFYGKKHSEETRAKFSERQKGTKRGPMKEETKRKIGERNKGKPTWIKGKKDPKGSASRTGVKHPRYRGEVYCYDSNAELFKIFSCNSEAAAFFGVCANDIRRVIIGDRNHCKGYSFKLKDQLPQKLEIIDISKKKVINTSTGKVYDTIREAANDIGVSYRNLGRYLNGSRENKTTLKFL